MTCLVSPFRFILFRVKFFGLLKFVYSILYQLWGNFYDFFKIWICYLLPFSFSHPGTARSYVVLFLILCRSPSRHGLYYYSCRFVPPLWPFKTSSSLAHDSFSSRLLRSSSEIFLLVSALFRSELLPSSCSSRSWLEFLTLFLSYFLDFIYLCIYVFFFWRCLRLKLLIIHLAIYRSLSLSLF